MSDFTECNYLLLVADSTRYDTAITANLQVIPSLGPVHKAWANGTYTWPSHLAMMMGHLPHCLDHEAYYNRFVAQLWRIGLTSGGGGGRRNKPFANLPPESSLPLAFRELGYSTIGSGAVSWFDHPLWSTWFESYWYGTDIKSQIDWFLSEIPPDKKFFGFLNFKETHEPYSHGNIGYIMPQGYEEHKLGHGPLSEADFLELRYRQVLALEYVDKSLSILLRNIPAKTVVVFTSDHGECFGEDNYFGHGFFHPKVMEVPLVISFP